MQVPSQQTVVVGGKITAAYGNDDIRDAINFHLDPPRLQVSMAASVSLTHNTWTLVTWDTETWDNDVMHDIVTNNSRLIAKTPGRYLVCVNAYFAPNATGGRGINLTPNGAGVRASANPVLSDGFQAAVNNTNQLVSATVEWNAATNDYLEHWVIQNSGGALNLVGGSSWTKVSVRRVSA